MFNKQLSLMLLLKWKNHHKENKGSTKYPKKYEERLLEGDLL